MNGIEKYLRDIYDKWNGVQFEIEISLQLKDVREILEIFKEYHHLKEFHEQALKCKMNALRIWTDAEKRRLDELKEEHGEQTE